MKLIITIFLGAILTVGMGSFTVSNQSKNTQRVVAGNVEFKITNNTSSEFKYCVNGGHNYISSGSTKSFSYSTGQDFYLIDGSNCGKQWFEVTNDMNGKTYKLTDLL